MPKADVFILGNTLDKINIDADYVARIPHDKITLHTFNFVKRMSSSPYFYIVKETAITDIDFSREVCEYEHALTFWNNCDSVRLFNREKVFDDPKKFIDDEWFSGKITDVMQFSDSHIQVHDINMHDCNNKGLCSVVLLTEDWPSWCNEMSKKHYPILHIDSFNLGIKELKDILERTKQPYIYVVSDPVKCFDDFNLDYIPPLHNQKYIHIWNNNESVRLLCREDLEENIEYYTDNAYLNGVAEVKNIESDSLKHEDHDIIFLSYDEPNADKNFAKLKEKFPRAKRVHGVKGIFEAHKAASFAAETSMFYVVDADAEIVDDFDFSFKPRLYDKNCVYVWRSKNPCNGLIYGYGGVKLFPTEKVRKAKNWKADFTTSVSKSFKPMSEVSNYTKFNTDSFSAWRSGFREAVKLSSKTIHNQVDDETIKRLEVWCTVALPDVPYAKETMEGAIAGKEYGSKNINNKECIKKINNYDWLKKEYEKRYNKL